MNPRQRIAILLAWSIVCLAASHVAVAAPPQIPTVVTVKKLCPTCGKKIVQKLSELPHVEKATMDVEQRTLRVTCTPGGSVSPRAVWETVERGGEQPIKLHGSMGTFTTKPPK
ncbi:MAG: cation transporter [Planctomycetes bacterium]|nr:cation transporter [Planctomycetota bacterium]